MYLVQVIRQTNFCVGQLSGKIIVRVGIKFFSQKFRRKNWCKKRIFLLFGPKIPFFSILFSSSKFLKKTQGRSVWLPLTRFFVLGALVYRLTHSGIQNLLHKNNQTPENEKRSSLKIKVKPGQPMQQVFKMVTFSLLVVPRRYTYHHLY